MRRLVHAVVQGLMKPLLAAAAAEGPGDTAGSGNSEPPGASSSLSHQRCMRQAIELAVLLLFQVQAPAPANMP